MGDYVVRTVLMDGSTPVTAASAIPETISRTLNEPDQAAISWPKHAYTPADFPVLGGPSAQIPSGAAEVQIFRNSQLHFWGPIISIDTAADQGAVSADLAGVDWYLNRRFIDAQRFNLVTNGSFEDGTGSWANGGGLDTFAATTDAKVLGDNSLRLAANTSNGDEYALQEFDVTGTAIGTLLTFVGWFNIESFTAQAQNKQGFVALLDGGSDGSDFYPIDNATPGNLWTRTELTLWVPPNETVTVGVKLYAPNGSILWDAVQVVAMESVSTAAITGSVTDEVDIAEIVGLLVQHVQNPAAGKSYVNIGYTENPTGTTAVKHYQYADHIQFDEAVREFVDRDDVGDWSIVYSALANSTSGTRTATLHTPRKGSDLSGSVTLSYPGSIANYRYQRDGAGTITQSTVLGEGDGPDREEGVFTNVQAVGGLVLEDVRTAPPKTQINSLVPIATEVVNNYSEPADVIQVTLIAEPDLIDTLDVGDIVAVNIDDGYVALVDDYRIVEWQLTCRSDTLELTLNKWIS